MQYFPFRSTWIFTLTTTLTLAFASCQSSTVQNDIAASDEHALTTVGHSGAAHLVTLGSVAELVERSTLIVIGTVEKTDRVINVARDVNDISKPDLGLLGLGQIYTVRVEQVVRGELSTDTIQLGQVEGFLVKPQDDVVPSPEDIALAREGYEYIPFTPEKRYLLFLEPLHGWPEEGHYAAIPHPNRFDISNPDQIRAESPAAIPGISTLDRLLADIAAVEPPTPVPPTPGPATPTPVITVISPLPTPADVATPPAEATSVPSS